MGDNEQKAIQLMADAERKTKSVKGFLGSFFKGNDALEEAIECYERAGNLFKMSKNWEAAGEAYRKAAKLQLTCERDHDAAINKVNAANCLKKVNVQDAISCLIDVTDFYKNKGKFVMAAKQHQSIAELCEKDANSLHQTVQHYQEAADLFTAEGSNSSATKCLLKVAHYSVQKGDYEKAIQIYEEVGESSLRSSLLKYGSTEYFFRAALCHLCIDILNAQHALKRYEDTHPAFQESREYKLLKTLIQHAEEQDLDGFTEALNAYNSIYRLDESYTIILNKIKSTIDKIDLR